ncbi:hypothetical protein [Halopseudomonas sp.]|uniref:hypothetical protein n=1 Tax=Halopseudomonas sp. TaxID=2901191 RepID=UPI003003A42D
MISEHHFASSFTSVWHKITPLADNYWRRENLRVTRELNPVEKNVSPILRGFVNELAFETFVAARKKGVLFNERQLASLASENVESVATYILRITGDADSVMFNLDSAAETEVVLLAQNLNLAFPSFHSTSFRPKFAGCGIVSSCEGDLIYQDCLYEVKAGDRGFRVSDIKQLLIYSSLAFAEGNIGFTKVGLFNPRNGFRWERTLDKLCVELSGVRESDVLSSIAANMSQLASSR